MKIKFIHADKIGLININLARNIINFKEEPYKHNIPKFGEWISVEEGQWPEDVSILMSGGVVTVGYFDADNNEWVEINATPTTNNSNVLSHSSVSCWMPLPSSPRKEPDINDDMWEI